MTQLIFGKLNVRVRDVDAAAAYVRDVLGGEILRAAHPTDFGRAAVVRLAGLLMEIIQPTPGSPLARSLEKRGEGVDSVGFFTADVSEAAGRLEERGARLIRPAGMPGTVWVHPKNPLSLSIEVLAETPLARPD